jgi:hypothetical protein
MTFVLAAVALVGALFVAAGLDDARTEAGTTHFRVECPHAVNCLYGREALDDALAKALSSSCLHAGCARRTASGKLLVLLGGKCVTAVHKRTLTAPQCDQHYRARLERFQADWNRCHAKIGGSESDARYDL